MKSLGINLRPVAVLLTICFLFSIAFPIGFLSEVEAAEEIPVYSAAEMAGKAVDFINDKYKDGEEIDGYTAYVLTLAGEDLESGKWTRNGKSVKKEIKNLADLLGDNNSLIDYITNTQNPGGSFGPYANEYGTKVPLQALAVIKDDLAMGSEVYDRVQTAINGAVEYFKTGYQSGSMPYEVNGWNFDYRCVEALAGSGVAVDEWVYDGVSLKDTVIASADAAAQNPSAKEAVYLAKELSVLNAVDPASSNIDILAGAITGKQNEDGSFGSSIYDHVTVLTALGKAGKLSDINQKKALEYLNNFKQVHKDEWGSEAGVAWGTDWNGNFQEEPDLTAQVLTALSYFDGAGTEGSDVNNAIQDGLAYLTDIQDDDTAAIPAKWDSTFATAETLIALKSLGKTYNEYAGEESPWVKRSKTKTIAQCLLAVSSWNDENRLNRLANLLINRQKSGDPGKGSFENSVYSDMWAYIALGEAGKIGEINTGDAEAYILFKQHEDGSWGETFGSSYYPDFLSTAQAIRALTYLPGAAGDAEIQAAIEKGLAYLKGLQQDDGGVYATPFDDPAVDNSETVITLHKLGKDPEGAGWNKTVGGQNVNPVTYLMNETMNPDGSFGTSKNVFGATESLYAYLLEIDEEQGSGDNNQPPPAQAAEECTVEIAVIGKDGDLLYGPGSVVLRESAPWGLTAMGALHATGLDYTEDGGFVKSIAGQANSGMNGWMYKVNNTIPNVLACDKTVYEGDQITWWYSTDPDEMPGSSSPANTPEEAAEPDDDTLFDILEETGEARLNIQNRVNASASLTPSAISKLANENKPLFIENRGVELEFPAQALLTEELNVALEEENASLQIQAREVSKTEKQEILSKADLGESTGLFDAGGKIIELNADIVRTGDDKIVSREKIENFNEPVKVTIDLSDLNLSDDDIARLTAVRYEKDNDGNFKPVELGGTYNPETKTFTFYTDRFSYYGVLKTKNRVKISLVINKLETDVNGEVRRIDVPPTIINGRTMVPLRFVSECLGAGVEWIGETKTVEMAFEDTKLCLVIGKTVPGLDTPATIINGRSFVPVRYVSESFGADVTWLPSTKTVEIVY